MWRSGQLLRDLWRWKVLIGVQQGCDQFLCQGMNDAVMDFNPVPLAFNDSFVLQQGQML